jgi:hypothetical protein
VQRGLEWGAWGIAAKRGGGVVVYKNKKAASNPLAAKAGVLDDLGQ